MIDDEIKKQLDYQTEILEKLLKYAKSTHKYILIGKILSVIKILIIVAPIIFGIIYLPGKIKELQQKYYKALPQIKNMQELLKNQELLNQYLQNKKE